MGASRQPLPPARQAAIERAVATALAQLVPEGAAAPEVPIDVERVAMFAGLRIVYMPAGLTGTVIQNVDGVPVSGVLDFTRGRIYVDASEVPARQRFTIAHEIAHEVLGHEHALGEALHAVSSEPTVDGSLLEQEADTFAGLLLVPPQLLAASIDDAGGVSVPLLAERFGVSAAAMQRHVIPWLPKVGEA